MSTEEIETIKRIHAPQVGVTHAANAVALVCDEALKYRKALEFVEQSLTESGYHRDSACLTEIRQAIGTKE